MENSHEGLHDEGLHHDEECGLALHPEEYSLAQTHAVLLCILKSAHLLCITMRVFNMPRALEMTSASSLN